MNKHEKLNEDIISEKETKNHFLEIFPKMANFSHVVIYHNHHCNCGKNGFCCTLP